MYGWFCITFPQSRMKGERHRLNPLSLSFCFETVIYERGIYNIIATVYTETLNICTCMVNETYTLNKFKKKRDGTIIIFNENIYVNTKRDNSMP